VWRRKSSVSRAARSWIPPVSSNPFLSHSRVHSLYIWLEHLKLCRRGSWQSFGLAWAATGPFL
jgi:hypothetical protein